MKRIPNDGSAAEAVRIGRRGAIAAGLLLAMASPLAAQQADTADDAGSKRCPDNNAGLSLPAGFCATVFADKIGHARHLVVAPDGVVYVNTWSGRYYGNGKVPSGGFLVALQDTNGNGKANVKKRFGPDVSEGDHGGTGIALYNGRLYAETNHRIVRYALPSGAITPTGKAETIVSGLPLTGDHPMHPFKIDAKGNLYVDLGSATNSCQVKNRVAGSPGIDPCTELKTRAGIWRYDANKTGQKFSAAERFATGLRNGEGIDFDSSGRIFATQHGRDQLHQNWPKLYAPNEGPNEPAEELVQLESGADFGWPHCYFDLTQQKLVLAPEYGGDGGKKVGRCAQKRAPVAAFPAHWAPNDLLIYEGKQFPSAYLGGAFIAFHGSWNRAPFPQGGYNVVFQPLQDGKASGKYIVFADGFAGEHKEPGSATHRPSGLALGPDGALYISDDQHGRIYRVTYQGSATARIEAAPAAGNSERNSGANAAPPEGINPQAGREAAGQASPPPGATPAEVALGGRIYHGQIGNAACVGCHGTNGGGTPLGPDLTDGKWLLGDGSPDSIAKITQNGVPKPKNYRSPMPAMGGGQLTRSEIKAVAAYVWTLSHKSGS